MNDTFDFRIPVGEWVATGVAWLTTNLSWLFDLARTIMLWLFEVAETVFTSPPFWLMIIALAAIAFFAKSWKLALATVIGFLLIFGMNQWENAMATIALVLVASLIATLIAIPLGIWAARKDTVSAAVRPVLDFMQTMPAFVYLIPAIVLFRAGVVPGIVATIIFAMAPGVRFTELGIRQVDREVVEAGHAFGATPNRILRQVQLPLALPTIMAGINQVIMLSLSMVVIAGMVGAAGLGQPVVQALSTINIGLGAEAGLAVVIVAMYLDRVTAALGDRAPVSRALKVRAADD